MIPLFQPSQVRTMDERMIDTGTPSLRLMERAAGHLARQVVDLAGYGYGLRVVILCGKGNNGGDGVALARRLAPFGAQATVCLVGGDEGLSDDGAVNLERWRQMGGREATSVDGALDGADLAVDCLLGTGARGAPREPYATVVGGLNDFAGPVLACDVPTGVDADTGQVPGPAVRADRTVTLGAHKRGLWVWPARGYAGDLVLGDLGFSQETGPSGAVAVGGETSSAVALSDHDLVPFGAPVSPEAEKRSQGVVAIWAGSVGMSGAAVLSGRAALAGGAGLVTLLVPDAIRAEVAVQVPEALTLGLPSDSDGALDVFTEQAGQADVLAFGPGLGLAEATQTLIRRVVAEVTTPLVVDADGLNTYRGEGSVFASAASEMLVLTPHTRELERLVMGGTLPGVEGRLEDHIWPERVDLLPRLARTYHATIVAKGPGSVIAAPDGRVWVNPTGSGALATGGTGDVLTGLTAALVATNRDAAAVAVAAYMHGRAGQLAESASHSRSVTALDVARSIPSALAAGSM